MPASGHQDHTTSPSASVPFVIGASASTASCSTSVTIASAPLSEQDGGGYRLICGFGKSEYFSPEGWTRRRAADEVICPSGAGARLVAPDCSARSALQCIRCLDVSRVSQIQLVI